MGNELRTFKSAAVMLAVLLAYSLAAFFIPPCCIPYLGLLAMLVAGLIGWFAAFQVSVGPVLMIGFASGLLVLVRSSALTANSVAVGLLSFVGAAAVGVVAALLRKPAAQPAQDDVDIQASDEWRRHEGRLLGKIDVLNKEKNKLIYEVESCKESKRKNFEIAQAVQRAAEPIVVIAKDGTVTYANLAFSRQFDVAVSDVIGKSWEQLRAVKGRMSIFTDAWHLLQRDNTRATQLSQTDGYGLAYHAEIAFASVRDAGGDVQSYVCVLRDVTREKQLETQLHQTQKLEAVARLASGVAHDFNNLLTVIGTSSQLILDTSTDGAVQDDARQILRATHKASEMTRKLLDFGRRDVAEIVPVDLAGLLKSDKQMLTLLVGGRVEISLTIDESLWPVLASKGSASQIVMNLVINARDAMPDGGQIQIRALNTVLTKFQDGAGPDVEPGEYVLLEVVDTGTGMDEPTLQRIFEPFYTTKEKDKGTGLGLSTVFGLVKASHGHVRVESELGEGTTFRVYFPKSDRAPDSGSTEGPASGPRGKHQRRRRSVLVVDDERALRQIMVRVLEGMSYDVHSASSVEEAKAIVADKLDALDLLITDVGLGGESGEQMALTMHAEDERLRVLLVSGGFRGIGDNCEGYPPTFGCLRKPFSQSELRTMVKKVLRGVTDSIRRP